MKKLLLSLFAVSLLSACYRSEPEGPGERIGRGLDEIAKGIAEAQEEQAKTNPDLIKAEELRKQQKEEEEKRKNLEGSDYYRY